MRRVLAVIMVMVSTACLAQRELVKGMVVDSLNLGALPRVHVRVKSSGAAAVTDESGIFAILAKANDTITFSYVGYYKAKQAVDLSEEIMFVRMRDQSLLLKEITIRDTPLFGPGRYLHSPTLSGTKPLRASAGGVNFAYFSKLEKEKRKLIAVIGELEQARKYIEIVTDPDFRYNMIAKHRLSEEKYYELLAVFNQTHDAVIHSSNESQILYALYEYFEHATLDK